MSTDTHRLDNLVTPAPAPEQAPLPPMTEQDFRIITGSLERYHNLRDIEAPSLVTPTSKAEETTRLAEIEGLETFIATELLNRAPELLGCWQAIKNEYEPIVRAFIPVFRRVALAVTRQEAHRAQQAQLQGLVANATVKPVAE